MHHTDDATQDELRALRVRAYGPAADIHRDPSAAERLRELESRAAAAVAVEVPVQEAMDATPPAQPADSPPSTPVAEPDATPAVTDPAPARTPRLTRVLWALSVVLAAAVAAAITFSLTFVAPVSDSGGATQIASLEPTATAVVPVGYMGAGPSSRSFEFYGYTIFETAGGFSYLGSQGSNCFAMVPTDRIPEDYDDQQGYSIDFTVYSGCGAGAFPAIAQFTVGASSTEELRAQFPDDAALRIAFDGDRVGVFLAQE
ncbi:hypothetical protein [Microbacterium sp.]|uniref:hypothetical protein n=1 Tax=Microbacterium sp. TaxID=51671 RepID=UPI003F6E4871